MTITEEPEKWIVVELPNGYLKVFATWTGGYLKGDRHKFNSGIKEVTEDDKFYYFKGYSGSIYKCHKSRYGIASSYGAKILNQVKEKGVKELQEKEWNKKLK